MKQQRMIADLASNRYAPGDFEILTAGFFTKIHSSGNSELIRHISATYPVSRWNLA